MYTTKVDDEISLALTLPSFSKELFDIIERNREEFGKWFPWVELNTNTSDTKEFIKSCIEGLSKDELLHNTIIYKGKVVGVVDIRLELKHFKGDIGYWLDKEYQGRGIMSKAVSKFIDIAFKEYNLEKVTITCDIDNIASNKVVQKVGMKHKVFLPKEMNVNSEQRDFFKYAMLRDEW